MHPNIIGLSCPRAKIDKSGLNSFFIIHFLEQMDPSSNVTNAQFWLYKWNYTLLEFFSKQLQSLESLESSESPGGLEGREVPGVQELQEVQKFQDS